MRWTLSIMIRHAPVDRPKPTPFGSFLQIAAPPLLRWSDRRPRGQSEISIAQSRILENLVAYLASTVAGRDLSLHRLVGKRLLADRLRETPLRRYQDIAPYVERVARGEPDVMFPGRAVALAQTSGTTSDQASGERYIPQNPRLLSHHARGGVAALSRLSRVAGSEIFGGRMLMLGGSTSLERNPWGVPSGDLSGISVSRIPWFLRPLYEPGRKLALESDWSAKVKGIAARLADGDVRLVTGIPSWCQVLFGEVCKQRGVAAAREAWPNLQAFVHGGVPMDPCIPMMRHHLSPDTWMMEVYPASEAFIAVGARPWRLGEGRTPDLELLTSHDVYLEFLRDDQADRPDLAVGAADLEPDALYRVLVTTPGGLIRYEIGDLVEGRGAGLVRFAGRIKARISVFGEHVEGTRLAEALAEACHATDSVVLGWHVAPVFPTSADPRGRHEWWVEFDRPPADAERFEAVLDEVLNRTVLDYQAHRSGDVQLLAPRLRILPRGAFEQVLVGKGKWGGQHKVPSASSNREWADLLAARPGESSP
jgi:hypothetical protein